MKYDATTDYIQIQSNGEWVNWQKAYLKSITLYSLGTYNPMTGGFVGSNYNGGTGNVNSNNLYAYGYYYIPGANQNYARVGQVSTVNKIDLTNYKSIKMKYTGGASSAKIGTDTATGGDCYFAVLCLTTTKVAASAGSNISKYVICQAAATTAEITFDISVVTGEYYISIAAANDNGSAEITCTELTMY